MSKTVIIIGAGLAGLSAALTAAESGNSVKLISLFPSERAQSVMAEGGINAALNTKGENDSPEEHFNDTIKAACGIADPNAVWNMTHAAPNIVKRLLALGVPFNMVGYDVDLRNFGGQKKKRTVFAKSETGKQLMTALIDSVRKYEADGLVERFYHHSFVTLLLDVTVCCGCVIRDDFNGQSITLPGDAVIIATGGMNGVFGAATGSVANTGEVTAELFRLGVPIANAEFVQYHPTTVQIAGKRMLISEAARGEGGRLFADRDGKPWYFMEEKYPELGNLMPRDVTSREIWTVSKESQVYLDLTRLPKEVLSDKLPMLVEDCKTYLGIDPSKKPIPVFPGIHYFMGGIQVDEAHRTVFQNLFAAGECCAQYHGANRLGGNSMLGAIYGGHIAAKGACGKGDGSRHHGTAANGQQKTSANALEQMHKVLQESMGVLRQGDAMQAALDQLDGINGDMILLGKAMLLSALTRQESRGAHFRADYPEQNDSKFKKTTVARYRDGEILISFESISERRSIADGIHD
jgi:succinate dehydrogenase / fumarate reductase flavoprotein subunit